MQQHQEHSLERLNCAQHCETNVSPEYHNIRNTVFRGSLTACNTPESK